MRFKVGDKVKVREDLVKGKCYGGDVFVGGMEDLKGKDVTIRSILGTTYRLEEDNRDYNWADEMLEPISNKEYEIKEEGMKNKLIVDLCKKVLEERGRFNTTGACNKIDCYTDNCPFSKGWKCGLDDAYERIEVAKKYLKDNEFENPVTAKTFREVINTIKKGEVWISEVNRISKIYISSTGTIMFEGEDGFSFNNSTCVGLDDIYTLQKQQYTFEEAFRAYEDNITIESCVDGEVFDKSKEGENLDRLFNASQIRGKWYINE